MFSNLPARAVKAEPVLVLFAFYAEHLTLNTAFKADSIYFLVINTVTAEFAVLLKIPATAVRTRHLFGTILAPIIVTFFVVFNCFVADLAGKAS